jgi:hypothetical protein
VTDVAARAPGRATKRGGAGKWHFATCSAPSVPDGDQDDRKGENMSIQELIDTHPASAPVDRAALVRCIEECYACAAACTSCADACLGEEAVQELVRCIRLDLDCADVCAATARVVTRQTAFEPGLARAAVEACASACRACAEECEAHAEHHEHCRVCAEACRRCEQACRDLLSALA